MEKLENGFQIYKPSTAERFWQFLGFGYPHVARPEDDPEFAEGWITTGVTTHFDWRDRVRILVSGKVRTKILIKTDVPVARAQSFANARVAPPWA